MYIYIYIHICTLEYRREYLKILLFCSRGVQINSVLKNGAESYAKHLVKRGQFSDMLDTFLILDTLKTRFLFLDTFKTRLRHVALHFKTRGF